MTKETFQINAEGAFNDCKTDLNCDCSANFAATATALAVKMIADQWGIQDFEVMKRIEKLLAEMRTDEVLKKAMLN